MVTTMDMHRLVGRRVAEARDRRGLSQAELGESMAQLLGEGKAWSNKVVSFVETGQRQLDSSELLIVAACLDVPVYQLLTPRPDEAVELPSGDLMDSAEVTRHVVGDARTDPRLATVAGRMEVLAEVADELAREARGTARVLTGEVPNVPSETWQGGIQVSDVEPLDVEGGLLAGGQDSGGERVVTDQDARRGQR